MRWALAVMSGLVAGSTLYLATFGIMPDDLGLVLSGAAIAVGSMLMIARLERR